MTVPPRSAYQLSPQAQRVFLEHPDAPPCTVSTQLLTGPLDIPRFQQSLAKVVARHEILRTTFVFRPGVKVPLQVIHDELAPAFNLLGRSSLDIPRSLELLDQEALRPFDLVHGPLLHVCLYELDDARRICQIRSPSVIMDSAAIANVAGEILLAYGGQKEALTAEPLQYADFSAWANDRLNGTDPDAVAGREFWRTRATIPAPRLAFERDHGAACAEDVVEIELDPDAVMRLTEMASQVAPAGGPTGPDVLFLTLYSRLLTQLCSADQVAVRVSLDARCSEEINDRAAVGLYAQATPVTLGLDGSRTVSAAMDAVCASLAKAARFLLYLPVSLPDASPIGYEAHQAAEYTTPEGIAVASLRTRCTLASCKLNLSLLHSAAGTRAFFYYDSRAFRVDDIRRLARTFSQLLQAADRGLDQPLDRLDCVAEPERRLLAALNETTAPIPQSGIHELFSEQAARTPERLALVCMGERFTYAALNARANQVAHWLHAQGIRPRDRVGLCVGRSSATLIGLLGILKAGAAYVPLLADNPRARLAYQLEAVGAAALLTETPLLDRLPQFAGPTACLDSGSDGIDAQPSSDPVARVEPEDLAYVIYTSGSTGVPKGVGIAHRSLVNYARSLARRLDLGSMEGLHFATVSTLAADLGNTCIFPPLIGGGCVHVIAQEVLMDGARFSKYTQDWPIDVLKITPSHLEMLLDTAGPSAPVLPQKYLITGGEPLSWELCLRVRAAARSLHLNHYGPTETTIGSLMYGPVVAEDPAQAGSATVPLGRPIDNTQIYVLSETGLPVPIGAPGELYIGGAGLARGYVNDAQQTRERFVRHPFSADPLARLYRTGDRVRCLPDGNVEFLGRIDRQIKIRGHRVEPEEVEQLLRQHPAVRQAAVLVPEATAGAPHLLAFFVGARNLGRWEVELRAYLEQHLPAHMIPSRFIEIQSVPLNANGKLDRGALLSMMDGQQRPRACVAPRTPIEAQIAQVWTQVLRVDRVGVEESFFDLGGHSLLATQLLARVRARFPGTQPSLGRFLAAPTVSALARDIAEALAQQSSAEGALLAELASMSEEEALRQLAAVEGQDG